MMRYDKDRKILNRKDYNRIKKYDRCQMENCLMEVYIEGYQDGKSELSKCLTYDEIKKLVLETKGIGDLRATEIATRISQEFTKEKR